MARQVKASSESTSKNAAGKESQATIKAIDKKYGGKIVVTANQVIQPDRIPTGIITLDVATLGGIPRSRCSMIIGPKSAGKSTTVSKIVSTEQQLRPDSTVLWMDIEDTFDSVWAGKLGVDCDSLLVAKPETGELAVDIAMAMVESLDVSMIVVDSVAALTPFKEYEGSAEDANVGIHAKMCTSFVRKLVTGILKERSRGHFITVLFINQLRAKINGYAKFGAEPVSVPGGRALGHATSLEISIKNYETTGKSEDGTESVMHNEHSWKIEKNKVNNGERHGAFILVRDPSYGEGVLAEGDIDDAPTILSYAKSLNLHRGSGASTKVLDLGNGKQIQAARDSDLVSILNTDPEVYWRLRTSIIRIIAENKKMPASFIQHIENQSKLRVVRNGIR